MSDLKAHVGGTRVLLVVGDITTENTQAIVNAANSGLMGGGGVDGAIHRAGGPQILAECKEIVRERGTLPAGQAVITGGGNLPARYVIHTVGPVWSGGDRGEDELLRQAYHNSLALAVDRGVRSLAFPAISTGAYRFPAERAAKIALEAVRDFLTIHSLDEVRLVLYSQSHFEAYERVWRQIFPVT